MAPLHVAISGILELEGCSGEEFQNSKIPRIFVLRECGAQCSAQGGHQTDSATFINSMILQVLFFFFSGPIFHQL